MVLMTDLNKPLGTHDLSNCGYQGQQFLINDHCGDAT